MSVIRDMGIALGGACGVYLAQGDWVGFAVVSALSISLLAIGSGGDA